MNIDLRLGDCIEVMKTLPDNSVDSVVCDPPYHLTSSKDGKKGFMGKEWDGGDIAFRTEVWKEALRVLKPGGHLLAFGGSRTYHRLAVAIEDAGFDIRDQIMWIYGSGFPKSLNIGKAIDKIQGNERQETDYIGPDGRKRWGGNSFSVGKEPDGRGINKKSKGNSDWEGWGTALKPAHEPIVMARKPLSEKSVAENVLKWGTGGINIDESRIGYSTEDKEKINFDRPRVRASVNEDWILKQAHDYTDPNYKEYNTEGRFPANIIFDDDTDQPWKRYFYCPKASKKEKDAGLDNMELRKTQLNNGGIGRKISVEKRLEIDGTNTPTGKNIHPTIKPIALMEYLIKLITPKGGLVMDCFMGSGSTGVAAKRNGFSFIGIEKEPEYIEIAQQRIDYER